jgi:hypothetical protein
MIITAIVANTASKPMPCAFAWIKQAMLSRKHALTPLSMPERSAELRLSVESEPAGDALKYENAVGQKPWTVSIRNHHGL